MRTLHIIGYKNSGKTTLIARWIGLLKAEGRSVAVLKHHGHGGMPAMPDRNTDTMQFWNNGADATVVAGGGVVQLLWNEEPAFDQLKALSAAGNPDVLFIEGYKDQPGEKIVLLREAEDWDALGKLLDIQLVVGCRELELNFSHIGSRESTEELDDWLWKWLAKEDANEAF
ncbi:molybdopterin-guanine dinucleotide biosynthesis protein B [Sporosarcina sp. 179-K 3D1 HS]|uniref:molybdopterin-guanine dinucleotide biosynthesis protein B n=1 Tax=Sporosarcina sp. 179-K 3D1 HS TaxID=3232169 RepID=UPI0039A30E2C